MAKLTPTQQRPDEPRGGGDGDSVHLRQGEGGLVKGRPDDGADVLGVAAGGDLRHHAAVELVLLDLGVHHRREDGAAVLHQGGGGLIAGGFNG